MDRNTIIAFLLIGMVLLLWPIYQKKMIGTKELPEHQEQIEETHSPKQGTESLTATVLSGEKKKEKRKVSRIQSAKKYDDVKIDTFFIETDIYKGALSSVGGGTIVSWKLKNYLDTDKKNSVDLVPDTAAGNLGLSLRHLDGRVIDLSQSDFQLTQDSWKIEDEDTLRILQFVKELEDIGRIEKTFYFRSHQYDFDLDISFDMIDDYALGKGYDLQWTSGLMHTERSLKDDLPYYQAIALQGDEMLKTKEKPTGLQEGNTHWVAVRTKYFLMSMMPISAEGKAAELTGFKIDETKWKIFQTKLVLASHGGTEEKGRFKIYLGPMDYKILKSFNADLDKMVNFGFMLIRPFGIAFFYALQFLYQHIHNYGWAIIIFSILIKIVLYPLTRKSFQSMKRMQELQPKMSALREKHKKDPQKLNQETMKLYKEHGVNPMGGCLPMILQMPVLFALFNLFRTTIMLRQAEFLMIKDLSAPDAIIAGSFNLLPVFLGISMIVQQKLSSTQNPQQKAMAYMMPVFLLFIFYKLSAGLNLYYLMFNVLTIAQELIIKKHK